ncbi:hypothetical protein E5329_21510 [Petralouisia muris]|uniref:Uncharacterized protein n=1 Tax=Petralouisia muris TaxID=3032872 RepID=A0AC61RQP4_9FIRM|nr:hypothetical protein [Petralouisia muris]TGY91368.1 hypothetical protein E5329_21510 [Petralouisia muris]
MKKKYIGAGVGAVLLATVLALAIWVFPLVQAAFLLYGMSESDGFQYEIALDLEEENLSGQQKQMVRILALILAGKENSGMSWEVTGRVSKGMVYGEVFCKGGSEPITEIYFYQEEGLVNVEMLYDSMRNNMIRQNSFLGGVLPEWSCGAFLSSSQVEEMFQVDLEKLFQAEELRENQAYSAQEIFGVLMGMKRQKGPNGANQFEAEMGDYQAVFEIAKEDKIPFLNILASDRTQKKEVSSFKGKFVFQETEEIVLPDSRMEDEDIRQFANLWQGITGLQDMMR